MQFKQRHQSLGFFKFIHSLHHKSFPFVLAQGVAELTSMRRGRRVRSHLPGPGPLSVSPPVAIAEPSTDWLSDPPPSLAATASSPSANWRGTARSRVNYRALATVGRSDA